MSCCSHPCHIRHGIPAQGSFIHYGHPGATLNQGMFVPMNQVPFSTMCADLSGGQCAMQGGVHVLSPPQQGSHNAPTPCPVQIAEPCDAKSSKISGSPCANPMLESSDEKGAKKHVILRANPTPEPLSIRRLPPPPAERCNPPLPPRYLLPKLPGCPPPDDRKFGELRGFPASSRCFPPREMYHYTTSKTYKLCYAK